MIRYRQSFLWLDHKNTIKKKKRKKMLLLPTPHPRKEVTGLCLLWVPLWHTWGPCVPYQ